MSIHWQKQNPRKKPNLENLRKRAKTLLKSVRAEEPSALARVGPYFGNPAQLGLQSMHLIIAREHGFSSWSKLKHYIEADSRSTALTLDQLANQFLDLVTVQYTPVAHQGPLRFKQAQELLREHPDIRSANIYTAAAIGDVEQLDRWLDQSPELIDQKGGYYNWEPLMYATYARLPENSTLAVCKRLLERGADPNAYYMSAGQYKFTALTGAFGQGEGGPINQPEHPDYKLLCRALLEKGANPNDGQAAYNRFFERDNTCLELLLEFGLNGTDKNNWLLSEDDKLLPHPSDTMHWQLIQSIRKGYIERARLLIDNGVDINKPDDSYATRSKGHSPYTTALLCDQPEIADYLLQAGAKKTELPPLLQLQSACSTADSAQANAILQAQPELAEEIKPFQLELLGDAISKGNAEALQLMIDLGFELNDNSGRTPLAGAALKGDLDIVKQLINNGADPTLRNPDYFSPAIGFALYAQHDHVVAYLATLEMDIFTASSRGNLAQIKSRLAQNPEQLEWRFAQIRPAPQKFCESDWLTPLAAAVLNNQALSTRYLLEQGADVSVSNTDGHNLLKVARDHGIDGLVLELIEAAQASKS